MAIKKVKEFSVGDRVHYGDGTYRIRNFPTRSSVIMGRIKAPVGSPPVVKTTIRSLREYVPEKREKDPSIQGCPFPSCGSDSVEVAKDYLCRWFYVECNTCFAEGPKAEIEGPGDEAEKSAVEKAIEMWNELEAVLL